MGNTMKTSLPGIKVYDLDKHPDKRGFFVEILRRDWSEFLGNYDIVQANLSFSHPGVIRAWHRHIRGQVDHFLVIKGMVRIAAYDDQEGSSTRGQLFDISVSEEKPRLVRIPGHYWHGFKIMGDKPALLVYFVNMLYDHDDPDEERRPWNDLKIIDPETGKPYDWNKPSHK